MFMNEGDSDTKKKTKQKNKKKPNRHDDDCIDTHTLHYINNDGCIVVARNV